MQWFQKGH